MTVLISTGTRPDEVIRSWNDQILYDYDRVSDELTLTVKNN